MNSKENAYKAKIRSRGNRKWSSWWVQVNPSADKPRTHKNYEHDAHSESYHCHHQIHPWRNHFCLTFLLF